MTRSNCEETSVFNQPENCPSVSDYVVLISGGRLFHANGPATEKLRGPNEAGCFGPRHNQVTLTCRVQMATCRLPKPD